MFVDLLTISLAIGVRPAELCADSLKSLKENDPERYRRACETIARRVVDAVLVEQLAK